MKIDDRVCASVKADGAAAAAEEAIALILPQ